MEDCQHEPVLNEEGLWVCRKCGLVLDSKLTIHPPRKSTPHYTIEIFVPEYDDLVNKLKECLGNCVDHYLFYGKNTCLDSLKSKIASITGIPPIFLSSAKSEKELIELLRSFSLTLGLPLSSLALNNIKALIRQYKRCIAELQRLHALKRLKFSYSLDLKHKKLDDEFFINPHRSRKR